MYVGCGIEKRTQLKAEHAPDIHCHLRCCMNREAARVVQQPWVPHLDDPLLACRNVGVLECVAALHRHQAHALDAVLQHEAAQL